MIYLASPYSHPDPAVRQDRFEKVCHAAAALIRRGHVVFSPIAHSHGMARLGLPTDWSFWETQDRWFLSVCAELWVLTLDGWQESRGVQAEITIAQSLGKPLRLLSGRRPSEPEVMIFDYRRTQEG
jgi:hypothetical protein